MVTTIHFHAGHNDPGYLPESDVEIFTTFDDARYYMIDKLLDAAENFAICTDEHDCEDISCPTYGNECPEQLASRAIFLAEELSLKNGPGWQAYLSDGRSLPVSWWITPCQEEGCFNASWKESY